jgi:beta-glucanase (GH16 family)
MLPLLLSVLLASAAAAPRPTHHDDPSLQLIFDDDFDTLDYTVWQHERTMGGGGNWEFQIYDNNRSNSWVEDGVLYIKPTMTVDRYGDGSLESARVDLWGASDADQCTGNEWYGCERVGNPTNIINPVLSARLRSSRGFTLRYGRVEVRARMPKGDWIWPAIWMLPKWNEYGGWPASGEIDLVESRGNLDLQTESGEQRGHRHAEQTLHWGPHWGLNSYYLTNGGRDGDFGDSFHTYEMDWTPEGITLSIDGETTMSVSPGEGGFWEYGDFAARAPGTDNPWRTGSSMAPFDKEFHFLMNVAVGGTNGFFPDSWTNANGAKPWSNTSPQAFLDFWNGRGTWQQTWDGDAAAMAVDYVRAWRYEGPDSSQ